ncbi:MAG: nitrilase-related carbon-nitrogen hydrolase [Chthoniobacteraceae bacterium]
MNPPIQPLRKSRAVLLALGAAACFHAAYSTPFSFLIFGYVVCLVQLARLQPARIAFYAAFGTGLLCFGPQLEFFWRIFGPAALFLWAILAAWIALFVVLTHASLMRLGAARTALLAPFLWTGLEYFRSELYYLRFSWLNVGFSLADSWLPVPFHAIGVYGIGFIAAFFAAWALSAPLKKILVGAIVAVGILWLLSTMSGKILTPTVQVAGVQMEFPSEKEVALNLDRALAQCPVAQLFVVSEYTFDGPVPDEIRGWCRSRHKYLIAGGKDPAPAGNYYNTAYVIGPDGTVVFKQVKSVPIQFFEDGLPAPEQKVWDSPWGKIGICICYDLSYSRVTDRLVRLGARALIVPTMDVEAWGRHEHELHERVALVRAAEYNIPVFRVGSSGISQLVDHRGHETATAPFAGKDAIICGSMTITPGAPRLPLDRFLAPFSVAVTAVFIAWLALATFISPQSKKPARTSFPK